MEYSSFQQIFFQQALQQCHSTDLQQRLRGLETLEKEFLEQVDQGFLLLLLRKASAYQEQSAILDIMSQMGERIPVDALLAYLLDQESPDQALRQMVAGTLAAAGAPAPVDVFTRLLQDQSEDGGLREEIAGLLGELGERVPFSVLVEACADPEPAICAAAIKAMSQRPALVPLELLLPYCNHPEWYVREAVIKTLLATGERVPIEPIIAALADPDSHVRVAASFGCIRLLEWFGAKVPLEPLLKALADAYAPVRENILDALGTYPERAPLEAITAALDDPYHPVRCAALDALSTMGKRVPRELRSVFQTMSGADPSAHVRQRATRALLVLNGVTPGPDKPILFDPTEEELERDE